MCCSLGCIASNGDFIALNSWKKVDDNYYKCLVEGGGSEYNCHMVELKSKISVIIMVCKVLVEL